MKNFNEEWLDVAGYEGKYQVSNFGRVRGVDRLIKSSRGGFQKLTGKVLSQSEIWNGYMTISLYGNGKEKRLLVHRLVAIAFIPNPENKATVNHIDSDRKNNRLDNLQWTTYSENTKHGFEFGKMYIPIGASSKLTQLNIHAIRSDNRRVKDIAAEYGVVPATISRIKNGTRWTRLETLKTA